MTARAASLCFISFLIRNSATISNSSVAKTSSHRLVITPNRIGSRPPYPSKGNGGHDTIRVHVHSFRSGTPGDVTVGGAAPVHPSSSRARSRRRHAAGRIAGYLRLDTSRMAETYSTRSSRVYRTSRGTGERNIPQARAVYLRERARCAHLARTQDVAAHLRSGQSESASSPIVCNSTRAARRVRRGRDSGHRVGAKATPFLHARIPPPRKHLARGTRGRRR
jgi:hypothetical protein